MTWINAQGQLYEGDCQLGDSEATAAELTSFNLRNDLAAVARQYLADLQSLNSSWLAAAVADGTQETTKKAAVTQAISDRKTQYLSDVAAVRAKYSSS